MGWAWSKNASSSSNAGHLRSCGFIQVAAPPCVPHWLSWIMHRWYSTTDRVATSPAPTPTPPSYIPSAYRCVSLEQVVIF